MNIATYFTYDSYKDSGVEWLGSIPQVWETKKLKFVTQIIKRIAGREGPDVLSITQQGIKVKDVTSGEGQLADDYSNYQLVYRGDFAMNHMDLLTGYVDISQFDGVVSPDYRVFRRTSDELDDRYLLLIFQIGYKQRIFFRYGQGVSLLGRWRFPAENFKEFQVPIPPLPEQRAIAAFLDEKCAKVDEAVRIKEEQITLLRERRQILIQQAVTRGLNPDAPMKDSGIDWIGQIPAHWKVLPLKYIARLRSGDTTSAERFKSQGFPVYGGNGFRGYMDRFTHDGEFALIGRQGALCGNVNYASGKFFASEHAIVASPKVRVTTSWLGEIIRSANLNRLSQSAAQPGLSVELIGNQRFPFPPHQEQVRISQAIEDIAIKINAAILIKEEQIAALKEYKTSLINAAVTGKIKVA